MHFWQIKEWSLARGATGTISKSAQLALLLCGLSLRRTGRPPATSVGLCRASLVFLTVHEDPDYVCTALHAGGTAYVVKARLASDLINTASFRQ
jgi:hypothetical protein